MLQYQRQAQQMAGHLAPGRSQLAGASFGLFFVFDPFYAFCDRGEAWQSQAQDLNARLSSEGVDVRTFLTRYMEVDIRNTRRPSGSTMVAAENWRCVFLAGSGAVLRRSFACIFAALLTEFRAFSC
jgi:hypothetical protein